MQRFFKKKNTGFTLVETLVAIAVFTVSILALMSVLASGISNTTYAKQKIIASYLAQEGIEYIRNMRDTAVLFGSGWTSDFKAKAKVNSCQNDTDKACGFSKPLPFDVFQCNNPHDNCKLNINTDGGYSTDLSNGSDSGFTRVIWMEDGDTSDEIKIYSKVEWTQGSGTKSVTFSENLFNWY